MHEQYAAQRNVASLLAIATQLSVSDHQEITILELSSLLTTLRLASHMAGAYVFIWLTLSLTLVCFAASLPYALMPVTPICVSTCHTEKFQHCFPNAVLEVSLFASE